jgi:adenosylcobinamide-phosphate synthase
VCYKAINTMDSMIGYRDARYLHFGRAAARLDDAANWLPARISAIWMVAAAFLTGNDWRNAWRVWRRDHANHASPNSAHTEAACAGALRVQLGGPASYAGVRVDKPTLGEAGRPLQADDIARAGQLMSVTGWIALLGVVAVRIALGVVVYAAR